MEGSAATDYFGTELAAPISIHSHAVLRSALAFCALDRHFAIKKVVYDIKSCSFHAL
jgi:hypothetical protein